ncbi:hypothetical protein I6F10_01525 [Pseudoalteromonas sp. SWYJZ98]|uniref:hypothetical protein n=1 Tax=Pseudoalteromonas sp. SWYJZ98 TaxID=2792060 RepID=UPI0018CCA449|nr:hypothetical protein [Pseudoalteromonas sp. SWYJZ98]MBH0029613.1 hypothetical protein [Pseudoalteromonas sp. SWYJZ98]
MTKRLPSRYEIVEPTLALIESLDTKALYEKYKTKEGWLNRGRLIQKANPLLSLKQAQNRGSRIYGSLQPAADAKSKEALEKGWITRLNKKQALKYQDTNIGELIEQTCKKYSTQGEIAANECQLRIHLENIHISKKDICKINEQFCSLMIGKTDEIFSAWSVVNLYWAVFTNNRRYIGLDNNIIYSSLKEVIFGNYLYLSKIPFEAHPSFEAIQREADFRLCDFDIYNEILMCDPHDSRACSSTSKRAAYSKRTKIKNNEYQENSINVELVNGDNSDKAFYEDIKTLIYNLYPNHIAPNFTSICKFKKSNLAYLLALTPDEVHKLIDDMCGRSNFRNNKYAEYKFLKNNYPNFSVIWKNSKARWQKNKINSSVKSRQKNSNKISVSEHVEIIWKSNLHKAMGAKPWKCNRQFLYRAWIGHYDKYKDVFKSFGITPAPIDFKTTFYVGAGPNNKNLRFASFINTDSTGSNHGVSP